ncbi:FHA domain-containing protein [Nocardioides psychrotolerans]|uniref:FHA domain-containing protein n=1 Tax=Nocardioides psychrotolerans TaxID=1005945 RepID=UPI003137D80A
MTLSLAADLEFEIERPGNDPVRGRLRGSGNRMTLEVDDPGAFAGAGDAVSVRSIAETLATQGLVIRVVHRGDHLVSLGDVSAPWWQRRVTGTRRIRLGSLRGVWTSARSRARGTASVLPGPGLVPPGTILPLFPTMHRRARRGVGTTHDPARGGGARLVVAPETVGPEERQQIFWLEDGMLIGSDPGCDLVLAGLEPVHARIVHDDRDEWVIKAIEGITRVHGAPVVAQILRTGARVELGSHRLAYFREEFADHGRPFGGRIGGEAGHQVPQPPREAVTDQHPDRHPDQHRDTPA